MMDENDTHEIINPAFDPARYANLDEQREGYAPMQSRDWGILTQSLTGEPAPEQPAATCGRRQRPRGSVGERRWLRSRGLL
ncbi:hypothetical protein ABK735_00035 [Enterobacter kobei]|uniref:hypothetical protein n=1 Tax=Enterobacter TaxID=547 RepID=UPI001E39F7B1|nr:MULTISPECIES: hypothetical protein [Enterobacter]